MSKYSAVEIAKYTITKCFDDGCAISNLALQKILYFMQLEYLKKSDKQPLFDDDFEAWQFGPVVPNVYYEFFSCGALPMVDRYDDIDINDEIKKIIDSIIEKKCGLKPWDLVRETHVEGKAWAIVYKDGSGNREMISKQLIREKG